MATRRAKSPLRAAGYVRLSVLTEETTSLQTQANDIETFCRKEGWVFDPMRDLFRDEGISGSKRRVRRPGYDALMDQLDRYDRVVVWKLDRFTRRIAQLADVLETFDEHEVALDVFGPDHCRTAWLNRRS
jgi:site-specific DNA recombinase